MVERKTYKFLQMSNGQDLCPFLLLYQSLPVKKVNCNNSSTWQVIMLGLRMAYNSNPDLDSSYNCAYMEEYPVLK